MGPFPHDAPRARISSDNPAGTDGFEFVEFAHPEPQQLRELFRQMGFDHVANHKSRAIELWKQGDVTYLINMNRGSHATEFMAEHGPSAPSMGWRVVDAEHAFRHAVARGARPYEGNGRAMDVPAIYGIGGSLIYFIDQYHDTSPYNAEFDWLSEAHPQGVGFYYLDHLTHNVFQGNMDKWMGFYARVFNFRELRFFNIDGRFTGLLSRAMTSPCGKIRIPINEDKSDKGQIVAYLRRYKGEGIQHIAIGTDDIYASVDAIAARGIEFMPGPNRTYYEMSQERVKNHREPIEKMMKHGILIDGEGVVGDNEMRVLLQIFSRTVIGPIFFEFIQRKGDDGFGEGNFKALFESIEREQIETGELGAAL